MKKITEDWIKKRHPCKDGIRWWDGKERDPLKLLNKMVVEERYLWANWFIVRVMTYKQYVSYAIFAAEQVIDVYEKRHPDDKGPRQAIEAARRCIKNPSKENKGATVAASHAAADAAAAAAYAAAADADDAADAAWAAGDADDAADAADAAAAAAAYAAAHAADAAAYGVVDAAYDAAQAASALGGEAVTEKKVLQYGIKLLMEGL